MSWPARGFRTLAVARGTDDASPLELVGLIPLYDPPREDSAPVIAEMQRNGVEVKMVTGDNMAIAREIGARLGLKQRAMSSEQLSGAAGSEIADAGGRAGRGDLPAPEAGNLTA